MASTDPALYISKWLKNTHITLVVCARRTMSVCGNCSVTDWVPGSRCRLLFAARIKKPGHMGSTSLSQHAAACDFTLRSHSYRYYTTFFDHHWSFDLSLCSAFNHTTGSHLSGYTYSNCCCRPMTASSEYGGSLIYWLSYLPGIFNDLWFTEASPSTCDWELIRTTYKTCNKTTDIFYIADSHHQVGLNKWSNLYNLRI